MAHDDGSFKAAHHEIALHVAARLAQPAGSLRESGSGVPAAVAGISIASAVLLPADHLHAESAWNQHIPFAFWLVQAHRPAIFVELGTFRGTSYFSFCQAVAALRLPTRCFAVDTWQGDSHTGFYDESVFAHVNACNELKYAGFSRLVRSSFDEALSHFLDGSIDLLHIDGLHTYEACRHDFESWLPKLSPRAVVLFHDTNVRERGFGVHRLWAELAERYPHFEFLHQHGLGVLGVGAALDAPVRELLAAADDAALTCEVRSTFWRLASAVQATIDLKASDEERARLETLLGVTIGQREIEISRLTAEIAGLRPALEEKERQAAELMAQCVAARSENAELNDALAAARSEATEVSSALAAARSDTAEVSSALAAARSETAEVNNALAVARSAAAGLGRALAMARGDNSVLNEALATARQEGAEKQAALDMKATQLAAVGSRAQSAEAAFAAACKELDAIRGSTSWRITRPLRQIAARSRFTRRACRIVKLPWWTIVFQLGARVRANRLRRANIKLIATSGLFDRASYLKQYPDVRATGMDPFVHYLDFGAREGRNPHPLFDSDWYLNQYPDVRASGIDPLVHYLKYGAKEGRDPHPLFDSDWYLDRYPAVRAAAINPLAHYLRHGAAENYDPCASFSTRDYLANNPDIAAIGINPLVHYCTVAREARPTPAGPDPQGQVAAVATYLVTNFAVGRPPDTRTKAPLIVCVSHVFPWLPRAGNEYRIARMLDWFSTRGHDVLVVVAPTEEDDVVEKRREELFARYANAVVCYRDGRVLASIKTLALSFATLDGHPVSQVCQEIKRTAPATDEALHHLEHHYCHDALIGVLSDITRQDSNAIYYINYGFMTRFLMQLHRRPISFVDAHDIFSHKTTQVRNYGIPDVVVTSEEEERMLRRADAVIAIHNGDAQALRKLVPGKAVINVGVDFQTTDVGPPSRAPNILFVAHLNQLNIKGIKDFIRFAWPLIKTAVPDTQFVVVGKIGQAIKSADRQVKLVGVVDSLAPYYRDARVVVNPAVAGTGLKIKTLEAIAYFRPVVAWPNGVDGVPPPLRRFCRVAENWFDFAEQTIALLRDEGQRTGLEPDRELIRRELSPDVVYSELSAWLSHLNLTP